MDQKLVAAIDGEIVTFGLVDGIGAPPRAVRSHKTADFPTFTDSLQAYLREHRLPPSGLSFGLAVAGMARGDTISLPHCRWYISVSGLKFFFGAEPLVLNEFESIAWSLPGVDASAIKPVGAPPPRPIRPGGRFLVVGAGAGLGVAILSVGADSRIQVAASEGGHISFAPQNRNEDELLAWLRARHGHVSFDRLLTGAGLQGIHDWLVADSGRAAGAAPAVPAIVGAAQRGDEVAMRATAMFARILGGFVGDMVLATGAFDGVFLVGPLLGSLLPFLGDDTFRAAMSGKGRMKKALDPVFVAHVEGRHPRLRGMAAALAARDGPAATGA